MVQLKCLIGSIGFVGKERSVKRGDIFETTDTHARVLVKQGYAQALKKTEKAGTTPEKDSIKERKDGKRRGQVPGEGAKTLYGDVKR